MSAPTPLRAPLTSSQQVLVSEAARSIKKLAGRFGQQLGQDEDDMRGVAHETLLDAARTFDPSVGARFVTHAWARARGEILDYIDRHRAHSGKGLLQALRRAGHALAETVDDDGDVLEDSDDDTFTRLEAGCDELAAGILAGFGCHLARRDAESELTEARTHAQDVAALHEVLGTLAPEEARLIELHYREGRPLAEVAAELGMSYRTTRRRHTEILERLAKRLRARGVAAPSVG